MAKLKWFFDEDENEVSTYNLVNVFYTDELECSNHVIETVINLYNNCTDENEHFIGSEGIIDEYLLNEGECTQEDREIICESIYAFLQSLTSPIKLLLTEKTLFITDGEMLEKVRDIFQLKQEPTIWSYDYTYDEDKSVSSGYLHYNDGLFYLSKNHSDKLTITIEDLK